MSLVTSKEAGKMYKLDRTIGLVTIASPVIQNVALLDVDEYLVADSMAVIHEGYINYIPIVNTTRRCKYMSVGAGANRGKGCIFNIKWVKVGAETFFVALSTEGLNIYDAEITEEIYHFKFKQIHKGKDVIPLGVATIKEHLCVGTDNGFVYIFKNSGIHEFELVHRVEIGDFLLIDGLSQLLVVASRNNLHTWEFKNCLFFHQQELNSESMKSVPAVMKVVPEIALVGYENGGIGVYSLQRHVTLLKADAHQNKITAIDYSPLKNTIITGSLDHNVKIWQLNFSHSCMSSLFCLETNYEICGVGFLTQRCTEFCIVKSNNISVDVFVKSDSEYE